VHDLPPIFHYWSNKFLRTQFERFGFSSPDQFFTQEILKLAALRSTLKISSLGSGRCESEIDIALALRAAGFRCNLESHYDIVLANQSLHHIVELERVFDEVKKALHTLDGSFLICDTIGRNGHLLWPEMFAEVQHWWAKLDPARRFDNATGRIEPEYVNYDCSKVGFEGIRAQDILPELIKRFEFELFVPHAGLVVPFVERRIGMNFDVNKSEDLAFVDALVVREQTLFADLAVKPTQMIGVLKSREVTTRRLLSGVLTPERCARTTA